MAQQDVYVNVDRPSRNPGKKKSFGKSLENIYENGNALESKRTGPAGAADRKRVKKGSCRGAAVCLGLLCLLLLTGFITLLLLYTTGNSEWVKLQTSYKNLSEERDWWQRRFEDMAKDRNAVQTNLPTDKNLSDERDELKRNLIQMYKNLSDERDELKRNLIQMYRNSQQDWVYFRGSVYYISSNMRNWKESREYCQQRGADLIIINSLAEQKFTRNFQRQLWIGLTDRETEGTWKWVDGSPLNTSYWTSHEPNGVPDRDEDCAESKDHTIQNSWNDEECDVLKHWICEMMLPQ